MHKLHYYILLLSNLQFIFKTKNWQIQEYFCYPHNPNFQPNSLNNLTQFNYSKLIIRDNWHNVSNNFPQIFPAQIWIRQTRKVTIQVFKSFKHPQNQDRPSHLEPILLICQKQHIKIASISHSIQFVSKTLEFIHSRNCISNIMLCNRISNAVNSQTQLFSSFINLFHTLWWQIRIVLKSHEESLE